MVTPHGAEAAVLPGNVPWAGPLPPSANAGQLPIVEEVDFTITGQFGGLPHALAVEGTTAYVSFGPRLFILDVSDPTNPQVLGQSEPLPRVAWRLAVAGETVFAACDPFYCQSLYSIDVSDPANPTLAGEWALPFDVYSMVPDGQGMVYLITQAEGSWVLNASDPDQPTLAGHLQVADWFSQLIIVEDTIYVVNFGLYVIEVNR